MPTTSYTTGITLTTENFWTYIFSLKFFSFSHPNPTHLPKHESLSPNHQFSQRFWYVEFYSVHAHLAWSQKLRLAPGPTKKWRIKWIDELNDDEFDEFYCTYRIKCRMLEVRENEMALRKMSVVLRVSEGTVPTTFIPLNWMNCIVQSVVLPLRSVLSTSDFYVKVHKS